MHILNITIQFLLDILFYNFNQNEEFYNIKDRRGKNKKTTKISLIYPLNLSAVVNFVNTVDYTA